MTTKATPFWYAVGAFIITPIAALFLIAMGLVLIIAWPLIPFLCYMQRRDEAT